MWRSAAQRREAKIQHPALGYFHPYSEEYGGSRTQGIFQKQKGINAIQMAVITLFPVQVKTVTGSRPNPNPLKDHALGKARMDRKPINRTHGWTTPIVQDFKSKAGVF